MTNSPAIALQALVAVGAAVVLQQYSARRSRALASAQLQQQKATQNVRAATNAAAFVVEIEYCTGCRWMLRAAWLGQELLTTFQNDLRAVKLSPNSHQGGVFRVHVYDENASSGAAADADKELLWCRKTAGRFPESKELKQIVRDVISPAKGLGHSDKK
ncbi:hypothetical protein PybrP1_000362 [[Pythium] brassicae (nom. inval.)]|nr:hypothetical protein PybrP1_000362 [[Pythium] brassicae (nom. inval.)]